MAAPLVLPLGGHGAAPALVGGKGAWLDRLLAAGFAVPPTAVVTTEAYRAVAGQPGLAELLDELASTAPPPPEGHEAARAQVDEAFLRVDLPGPVARALGEADAAVRAPDGLVAARSSATAEDLHGTSFAGQYRSFLELGDAVALERAVRLVWASLWHPAPRTYRRFHGVDGAGLAMAVVVMHQVPARSAGVAFTTDPGGTPGVVRVEAVEGLGEQLVSGEVTPTVHLVPRDAPDDDTPDPIAEVASLALRVEEALGEAQDLEWARDDERLWLLQARPITTGGPPPDDDGFDTSDAGGRRWTTTGIAEMLPGVLPPLRWEVCRLLLEEALRSHEATGGALPVDRLVGRDLLGRVRGRAALDADLLDEVRAAATESPGGVDRARRSLAALRSRRRAVWEAATAAVAAAEVVELLPDEDELAALPSSEVLALRRRAVDLAGRAMAAEVAVAGTAVATTERLQATLARYLDPEEAAAWTGRVTARPHGTVAGWPRASLTTALVSADAAAVAALADADGWEDASSALAEVPGGTDLLAELDRTLHRAGSRAVPAGPTWGEDPGRLWAPLAQLAAAVRDGRVPDRPDPSAPTPLDDLLDGLAADPAWRRQRWLTAQVVDLRRAVLRWQAEDASDLLERRERAKVAVLALGGVVRRTHRALGQRLCGAGVLESPEDVELLGEHELRTALAALEGHAAPPGGPRPPTQAELARRRRWLAARESDGPLPESFAGRPPPSPAPAATGDVVHGWGASGGRISGPARVLHDSGEGGLHRGDVLVARSTDASWAPLFMGAAAVVVEEGGPLSHAAIVARELGIPAVLNLPGIVARLDGAAATVTVDGDAGTVAIGPPGPAVPDTHRSRGPRWAGAGAAGEDQAQPEVTA